MEAEVIVVEKKKRGRPPTKRVTDLSAPEEVTSEQQEQYAALLKEVEAECPYPKDENGNYGLAGQGWCSDEFEKRKKLLKKTNALAKSEDSAVDAAFVSEAKKSDKRIDKALHRGSESFFEAVKELIESGDKGYYKALGFKTFNAYRESKSEYSRSHISQGIQAYKALHNRIPDDKLMTIPIPTAVLLTRLPESKLTDELIDAAVSMKIQDFKEQEFPKHASQLVDSNGNAQPIEPEDFAWIPRMRVHSKVATIWNRFMEVARWKAIGLQDEHDVYGNFTTEEKALLIIAAECGSASGWTEEFENSKHSKTMAAGDELPAF